MRLSRRPLCIVGLFCLGLSPTASWSQETDKKYSFEFKAISVPAFMKELTKATGTNFVASAGFDDVPVITSIHDRTLKEVMDKIATATLGTWSKTESGYRLDQDKEGWKRLQQAAYEERKKYLAEALKKHLEDHKKDEVWDRALVSKLIEDEQRSNQKLIDDLRKNNPDLDTNQVNIHKGSSRSTTPATPALYEILRRMPIDALARVAPGQRIVFSTAPTRTQTPLPFSNTGIVSKFVEAHNLLANATKGQPMMPDNIKVFGGLDLNAKTLTGQQVKMLVIVSRRSSEQGIGIEVKFADENGIYIGNANRSIQPSASLPGDPPDIKVADEKPLAFEQLSTELANAIVNGTMTNSGGSNVMVMDNGGGAFRISSNGPTPGQPLSPEALSYFADPVVHDPQSSFASEALLGAASAANKDLVACLPDSVLPRLARASIKSTTAGALLKDLHSGGCEITDADGWLVVTPRDRIRALAQQMNRAAAKKLYSAVIGKGYARLHQLAQFAQSMGTVPQVNNFGVTTLKIIDPYAADALVSELDIQPTMLQFLGTLDATTFEGLNPEFKLGVINASSAQKGYLERMAFGADRLGGIIGDGDFTAISMSSGQPNEADPMTKPAGLHTEPTETMPNGLPLEGQVTINFKPQEVVQAFVKGRRGGQFLTAGGLGGNLAFQETMTAPEFAGKLTSFDSFYEAKGLTLDVWTQFTKAGPSHSEFSDAWIVPGTTAVAFGGLSASFRDAVAKSKEEMGKARFHFGNTEKPPRQGDNKPARGDDPQGVRCRTGLGMCSST